MALTWDQASTITRERFIPKLVDNIYDKSALLKIMLEDGRVKESYDGGRKIVQPIKYAKSTAVGTYDGYQTFDMTPPTYITAAEFNWGHYYSTVSVDGITLRQNMGKERVLDIMAERVDEAGMTLRDKLADDLYYGTASTGVIGLDSAVDAADTYGGIAVADFSGWAAGEDTTAHTEANMKDSTSTSYIVTLLQAAFRSATHLGSSPNLVVTTLKIFDVIEMVLHKASSFNTNNSARVTQVGNLGFPTINFRGVPIVADEKCPANYLYVLNTDFMKFVLHPQANFYFTGYKVPVNQDAKAGQVLLDCQLTLSNRRMFYKFSSLAAS